VRAFVKLPLLEVRITMIFLSLYWTFPTEPFFIPSLSNLLCNSNTVSLGHWKGYIVKHNYVNQGVFNGYTRQLHVSAFTGHLQVVFKRT